MVWVFCNVECAELADKWMKFEIRMERFILDTDSMTYPGYVGLSFSRKYVRNVVEIAELATGLPVLFYKARNAYVVDTRHFIRFRQPHTCACGKLL